MWSKVRYSEPMYRERDKFGLHKRCWQGWGDRTRPEGAGEGVQQLRAFVALTENLSSIPGTHMMVHNHP